MPAMTEKRAKKLENEVMAAGGKIVIDDKRSLKTYMTLTNQFKIGRVVHVKCTASGIERYTYHVA